MLGRVCAWCIVSAPAASAQASDRTLLPGSTVLENLTGNGQRTYRVQLPPGETMPVSSVERQGVAGTVVVLAADGSELAEADPR